MASFLDQARGVKYQQRLRSVSKGDKMTVEPFVVGPQKDETIQEAVPIRRGHARWESWRKRSWWHRRLVVDDDAVGQYQVTCAMFAEKCMQLSAADQGELRQSLSAQQAVTTNGGQICRFGEVVEKIWWKLFQ
jgi:hypothetical protein